MKTRAKVIIADDHPIMRQGLRRVLDRDEQFEIVAEAGDGVQAKRLLLEYEPDIMVLDISMPGLSGLEVVADPEIRELKTRFVILTMYREAEYFNHALDLGVMGYLLKDNAVGDLLSCLHTVISDRHFVSPVLSDYLITRQSGTKKLYDERPGLHALTEMERRVLKLISENKTSREIAAELYISHRTVQNHRTNMCAKLDLRGHNKLLQFALENKSQLHL
jgi:DNA-binding NarL/FixJ family response regulator